MSSFTNYAIKDKDALGNWILRQLGWPLVEVEITAEALNDCCDAATEIFTKYVIQEKKYIAVDCATYDSTSGFIINPSDGSSITSIYAIEESSTIMGSVGDLFSTKNVLWNNGMFPTITGSFSAGNNNFRSGSFIQLELALQYVDLMKRMLGGGFQYEYNSTTRQLFVDPDPQKSHIVGFLALGCNVIRPDDQQYGEEWVKRYGLAMAKTIVGRVRSKLGQINLLGGGQIEKEMLNEGKEEMKTLIEEIQQTYRSTLILIG